MVAAARGQGELDGGGVDVSVLVPFLNEEAYLPESMPAMLNQEFDGRVEYLFIDSGSTDGGRAVVEAFAEQDPRIRLLENPARTTAVGLNIGLRHARGRYVARMDAHTIYPPTYLRDAVERLERGDADWVSGPQLPAPRGKWSRRIALALGTWLGTGGPAYRLPPDAEEVEVDSGFTGVWRRRTLEELGGWDEAASPNEDGELAARMLERGMRLVMLQRMAASYWPRESLEGLARQYYRYGRARARTWRLHPDAMRPTHLLPPLVLGVLVAAGAAPSRRLRAAARVGSGIWLAAIASTAVSSRRRASASLRDALAVPLVVAVMHLSWGAGFVAGSLRHGLPVRACWRALNRALRRAR